MELFLFFCGAATSWAISHFYYRQGSRDLNLELKSVHNAVRRLTEEILNDRGNPAQKVERVKEILEETFRCDNCGTAFDLVSGSDCGFSWKDAVCKSCGNREYLW